MIKVSSELGEFQGDTLEQATKALRAAERAAKRDEKRRGELYKLAMMRARATGYSILARFASRDRFPRGWKYYPTGDKHGPRELEYTPRGQFMTRHSVLFDTPDGQAKFDFIGHRVIGHVWNGAGFTIAFFLQDDTTGEVSAHCLGVADDVPAMDSLPEVAVAHFERD
jgi:hypothetical protein